MDATRLYLAECVGVIVLPISRIIIASAYKELTKAKEHNLPEDLFLRGKCKKSCSGET